jgi:hypothetical protein
MPPKNLESPLISLCATIGIVEKPLLLLLVTAGRTCGRTSRGRTRDAGERQSAMYHLAELKAQVAPSTHVLRLLLNPEQRRTIPIKR